MASPTMTPPITSIRQLADEQRAGNIQAIVTGDSYIDAIQSADPETYHHIGEKIHSVASVSIALNLVKAGKIESWAK